MKLKVNVIRDKGNVKYVGNQILAAKLGSQIFLYIRDFQDSLEELKD